MTEKEACRILGILPGTGMKEAKRRYRQLMLQVHPDIGESAGGQTRLRANMARRVSVALLLMLA